MSTDLKSIHKPTSGRPRRTSLRASTKARRQAARSRASRGSSRGSRRSSAHSAGHRSTYQLDEWNEKSLDPDGGYPAEYAAWGYSGALFSVCCFLTWVAVGIAAHVYDHLASEWEEDCRLSGREGCEIQDRLGLLFDFVTFYGLAPGSLLLCLLPSIICFFYNHKKRTASARACCCGFLWPIVGASVFVLAMFIPVALHGRAGPAYAMAMFWIPIVFVLVFILCASISFGFYVYWRRRRMEVLFDDANSTELKGCC